MTAKKRKVSKKQKEQKTSFLNSFNLDSIIPPRYQAGSLIFLILIIFLFFYSPLYFGGKTFQSGDIITSMSAKTYIDNHGEGYTLWNPYIFGGMPAYAISVGFKWFNLIVVCIHSIRTLFGSLFTIDYASWTFYLFALACTMFIFIYNRTNNKLISLMVSLATAFSTGLVVFLYIGHVTKLSALWVYPIILMILFLMQKRIRITYLLILIVFIDLMFIGWHVQIIFYTFFAVMIYYLYFFFRALRQKNKKFIFQLLKSACIVIAAIAVALLIQLDNLTQIYEYSPYSTRGTESILEKDTTPDKQSESDFYQYATNWSFSPGEVLTFMIPSYYGFGKSTYKGPLSQNQPVEVNTYFGQMPFVDVAMYMGVIIFFLAVFSMIINWRDPFVRYLTILSVIGLLISFGRTFPLFYDLMFNYFPFFNKFRVPSMILVLVQLSFPILAGLGIARIISLKKESNSRADKLVRNTAWVFTGLLIFTFILSSPIREWFINRVTASGKENQQIKVLHDYLVNMFITDARYAFFFSAAVFGIIYAYLKSKLSTDLMILGITVLIMIDIIRIDLRGETYVDYSDIERQFAKPEYIQAIESFNDNSVYRILNLKQDRSNGTVSHNSNFNAYFLQQDLYGYSGIKPRAYQDYMDVLGGPTNPTLWRMANVKYLIFDGQLNYPGFKLMYSGNKTFVYENQRALPRAYFVNSVESREGMDILTAVKDNQFDPMNVAFTEKDIPDIDQPDSTVFVNIVNYKDETIELDVNASGNNFLFLGDTYYSGITDYKIPLLNIHLLSTYKWRAFIDGNETTILRTNHGFRGIVVPKGRHSIIFNYLPNSFVISKYLALLISSITLLGLIIVIISVIRKKKITSNENIQTT